jgi:hypothetical protein
MANLNFGPTELAFLLAASKNATIQGKDAVVVAKIITTIEKALEKASIPPEVAARKK